MGPLPAAGGANVGRPPAVGRGERGAIAAGEWHGDGPTGGGGWRGDGTIVGRGWRERGLTATGWQYRRRPIAGGCGQHQWLPGEDALRGEAVDTHDFSHRGVAEHGESEQGITGSHDVALPAARRAHGEGVAVGSRSGGTQSC